jgi:hypothetical protein
MDDEQLQRKDLYQKLKIAFQNIITDDKKLSCYEYFRDTIRPTLDRSSYVESENTIMGLREFTFDMEDVKTEYLSTLLGVALYS